MAEHSTADGVAALAHGSWDDARIAFEAAVRDEESAEACFGLARALWWLGESEGCVERGGRAYALFRAAGDVAGATNCAIWLAITYKANFANAAAANGWLGRAERLLEQIETGPLHGWLWIARGYRMTDLDAADALTARALEVARTSGDTDLELVALSQLGLVHVGRGDVGAGFALIDEAMAAALAGEGSSLDTVVYACCDMLNACELATDIERATQWCQVADGFVAKYGCPFLYAECRLYYGSVLTASGRWEEAERELTAGARITAGTCPGLHQRALARLASLRIRQGRLEQADALLGDLGAGIDVEAEASVLTAALALARGDPRLAAGLLERRLPELEGHRAHLASGLDVLVDAHVAAGRLDVATGAAERLGRVAGASASEHLRALATAAQGRVLVACGDIGGVTALEAALRTWSTLPHPWEAARTRFDLAQALAERDSDAAIEHARRALAAFDELGATIDADRAAAFLRARNVVARTGAKRVGTLTDRERDVLALVGAGLSNPEIAERLHISPRTASHHVSHILTKLGLRNRAEIAARAGALLGE